MSARMVGLVAVLTAVLVAPVTAQSPRERRDVIVNPPTPQSLPGQLHQTIEPSRWGTAGTPVGQPQWGTLGAPGWSGVTTTPQPPR